MNLLNDILDNLRAKTGKKNYLGQKLIELVIFLHNNAFNVYGPYEFRLESYCDCGNTIGLYVNTAESMFSTENATAKQDTMDDYTTVTFLCNKCSEKAKKNKKRKKTAKK